MDNPTQETATIHDKIASWPVEDLPQAKGETEEVTESAAANEGEDAETDEGQSEREAGGESTAEVDEGEEEQANTDGEPEHTLNYRGQVLKVSTQELRDGYLRDKDYRHKTEEVKAERVELSKEREAVKRDLLLGAWILEQPLQPTEELQRIALEDPGQYNLLMLQAQQRRQKAQELRQKYDEYTKGESEKFKQDFEVRKKVELEALHKKVPDLAKREGQQKLVDYLAKNGVGENELDGFIDHRQYEFAWKAMLWDAAQATVTAKAKDAPKGIREKARATEDSKTQQMRALKDGIRTGDRRSLHEFLKAI